MTALCGALLLACVSAIALAGAASSTRPDLADDPATLHGRVHSDHPAGHGDGDGSDPSVQAPTAAGGVQLLLHLTDIHLSAMAAGAGGDPTRSSDLLTLASGMLARWPLAAAVVTGDLTEAKNRYGGSRQDEREWRTYQDTWRAFLSYSGVSADHLYDIRGNHDTFDSGPRCGAHDFYCRYSTRAARSRNGRAAADTQVGQANSSTVGQDADVGGGCGGGAVVGGAAPLDGPAGRVFIDPVYDTSVTARRGVQGDTAGADSRGGSGTKAVPPLTSQGACATVAAAPATAAAGCPRMVLVGIDASLDPGMRSPTNFLGVVRQALLDELDERLAAFVRQMRSAGCTPPYIAYGHYPLSTIAYPDIPGPGRVAASSAFDDHPPAFDDHSAANNTPAANNAPAASGTAPAASLQDVLARRGVSAYLCGHLHGAFGRRLHRLHPAPAAASRGTTGGTDGGGGGTGVAGLGHLLELESVDWKHARTVRLVTLDPSGPASAAIAPAAAPGAGGSDLGASGLGALGFADFRYRPRPTPQTAPAFQAAASSVGQGGAGTLEPFDPTCTVGTHLALITYPPDARYSPQLGPGTPYGYGGGGGGGIVGSGGIADARTTAATGDSAAADSGLGVSDAGSASGFLVRVLLLPIRGDGAAAAGSGSGGGAGSGDGARDGGAGAGGNTSFTSASASVAGERVTGDGVQVEGVHLHWACDLAREGSGRLEYLRNWLFKDGSRQPQLSGVVQMRLEAAQDGYSSYVVDLLATHQPGTSTMASATVPASAAAGRNGAAPASGGAEHLRVDDGGGAAHPRSCPPGFIVVQARVGGTASGGDARGSNGDVISRTVSTSAQRLLHWRPPLSRTQPYSQMDDGDAVEGSSIGGTNAFSVVIQPAPMGRSAMEWLATHVSFHRVGRAVFIIQWCVLVIGLLLLPQAMLGVSSCRAGTQPRHCAQQHQHVRHGQLLGRRNPLLAWLQCTWRRTLLRLGWGKSNPAADRRQGGAGGVELADATAGPALSGDAPSATPLLDPDRSGELASTSGRAPAGGGSGRAGGIGGSSSNSIERLDASGGSSDGDDSGGVRRRNSGGVESGATDGPDTAVEQTPLLQRHGGRAGFENVGVGTGGRHRSLSAVCGVRLPNCITTPRLLRRALRRVAWPLYDFAELAQYHTGPWVALVLYGVFLAVGPWLVAEFVSPTCMTPQTPDVTDVSTPPATTTAAAVQGAQGDNCIGAPYRGYGILTVYGVYLWRSTAAGGAGDEGPPVPSADHIVVVNALFLTCIAPATLLCASAAAGWRKALSAAPPAAATTAGQAGSAVPNLLTCRQTAALAVVVFMNAGLCWKLWAGLGWTPLLLSPGAGWLLPLLLTWLVCARRHICDGCVRRDGAGPSRRG